MSSQGDRVSPIAKSYGPNYFESIRNWDKEKNKLLEAYGYSLKDDLKGKFEFAYKDGKPFLRVLDTSIKRVNAPLPTLQNQLVFPREEVIAETLQEPETTVTTHSGLVLYLILIKKLPAISR